MITSRCRAVNVATVVALVALCLLSVAAPAAALERPRLVAERAAGDTVLVRESDVVEEDLYAGGNRVLIEGTVKGDLTVAAFREVIVTGTVEGDLVGYSPLVQVDGTVQGSVRVVADVVRVQGEIGEDLFTGARATGVTGTVGRDVQAWGLTLDLRGTVGRDVRGWVFDRFRLGGSVGRDVEATAGRFEMLDGTRVEGSVGYRSDREADVGDHVEIGGVLTRREPLNPNVRVQAIFALTTVLAVLAIIALGFSLFWLAPRSLRRAVESVQTRTLASFFTGLAVLVIPVAGFVALVVLLVDASPELALPSAVIGLPVGFLLLGLVSVGVLVSPVPVFTAVGSRIVGRRRSALFAYLVGMVIWVILLIVPVVRVLVSVLVAVLGLGAWTLGIFRSRGTPDWAFGPGPATAAGTRRGRLEEADWTGFPTIDDTEPLPEIGEPFDGEMQLPFDEWPPD